MCSSAWVSNEVAGRVVAGPTFFRDSRDEWGRFKPDDGCRVPGRTVEEKGPFRDEVEAALGYADDDAERVLALPWPLTVPFAGREVDTDAALLGSGGCIVLLAWNSDFVSLYKDYSAFNSPTRLWNKGPRVGGRLVHLL